MHQYAVRPMHGKESLLVEFISRPEDDGFRADIEYVFGPLGFKTEFNGHYFYMRHGDPGHHLAKLSIESDQWGSIWGDADPYGEVASNHELIARFDDVLSASGRFKKVTLPPLPRSDPSAG